MKRKKGGKEKGDKRTSVSFRGEKQYDCTDFGMACCLEYEHKATATATAAAHNY